MKPTWQRRRWRISTASWRSTERTGAEKRAAHSSKGSTVFRDPNQEDRLWAIFDWDLDGWQSFVSDPELPPIIQRAGHKTPPQATERVGQFDA